MNHFAAELPGRYFEALQSYLNGDGESALLQAYELGRTAVDEGVGLLDMVAVGHRASHRVLFDRAQRGNGSQSEARITAVEAFLIESLSAFELTHRSHSDANMALRRLNQTVEEEIKRVAYSLHDDASQLLAAAYLALGECARSPAEKTDEHLKRLRALLDQVGEQLRHLSHELHPSILDDFGLTAALEFLAEGLSKRSDLTIAVTGRLGGRLPANAEIVLYRIAQESLANVVRHARATYAEVELKPEKECLHCIIKDNGVGFDAANVLNGTAKRGLGLRGIQERVLAVGGTLDIHSTAGKGTQLQVTVPLLA